MAERKSELAAGNGPDILLMDDISYSSYLQKGVLEELSSIREKMTEETHFVSVIDAVNAEASGSEDGLYMVPLVFVVPVLAGDADAIESVRNHTELADLLVEAGEKNGGSVIGTVNAEEVLYTRKCFGREPECGGWRGGSGESAADISGGVNGNLFFACNVTMFFKTIEFCGRSLYNKGIELGGERL